MMAQTRGERAVAIAYVMSAANKMIRKCKRERGIVMTGEEVQEFKNELKKELNEFLYDVRCADGSYIYDRYHLYVEYLASKFYVAIDLINVEGIKPGTRVSRGDTDAKEAGRKTIEAVKELINERS